MILISFDHYLVQIADSLNEWWVPQIFSSIQYPLSIHPSIGTPIELPTRNVLPIQRNYHVFQSSSIQAIVSRYLKLAVPLMYEEQHIVFQALNLVLFDLVLVMPFDLSSHLDSMAIYPNSQTQKGSCNLVIFLSNVFSMMPH